MFGRGVFANRDFRRLWTADAFSQVGTRISLVAVPMVAVSTLDASAFEVSLLPTAGTLPFLLLGLPATPSSSTSPTSPTCPAWWAGSTWSRATRRAGQPLGGRGHGPGCRGLPGAGTRRAGDPPRDVLSYLWSAGWIRAVRTVEERRPARRCGSRPPASSPPRCGCCCRRSGAAVTCRTDTRRSPLLYPLSPTARADPPSAAVPAHVSRFGATLAAT
jgi:hypothetical protein